MILLFSQKHGKKICQKLILRGTGTTLKKDQNIKNAITHSGGITILAKHTNNIIRSGIKLVENAEGFLCFKLDKNVFQTDNDIFLCGAYILPKNTTKNILAKTGYLVIFKK